MVILNKLVVVVVVVVMSPSFQNHVTKKRRALGTRTDFAHV